MGDFVVYIVNNVMLEGVDWANVALHANKSTLDFQPESYLSTLSLKCLKVAFVIL